jgi:LuxR family quorum-sensing system transcriptional regulator CciR
MTGDRSDLASRAFGAVADIQKAGSIEELDRAAGRIFAALDCPSYALARFFKPDGSPGTEVLAGSFEPGWAARYTAKGYASSSQIARHMLSTSRPYSWSEVISQRGLEREQARIWNEARDFGLKDGLFTPLRWGDGSYVAVVLAGSNPEVGDPLLRSMAEVVSAYYSSEAKRLLGANKKIRPLLSPRQRECLAWVRHGKSSADISAIMGISAQTVEEHVGEACRKLGVRTRVQAAVEATLLGLIDQ